MNPNRLIPSILPVVLGFAIHSKAAAQTDPRQEEISKVAHSFVDAFHKGDAKTIASLWTPDGDYVDDAGRVLKGREAIEKSFAGLFAAQKDLKVRIDVASLRFPTQDVAIEDGTTAVMAPDGSAPTRARYTNVMVKKDGQWLLSSVRESAFTAPSNIDHLSPLDWVIGDWISEGKEPPFGQVSFEWSPGQNFIVSTRTVESTDASLPNGVQWIGWDPNSRQIRSWSFEADGGFGQSTWTQDGGTWTVKSEATIADGSKVTSTTTLTRNNADTITVETKHQSANGQALPDTKPIKMSRISGQ